MSQMQKLLFGGEEPVSGSREYQNLSILVVAKDLLPNPLKLRPNSPGQVRVSLCSFHKECTPSAFFRPRSNTFRCYGCNHGGGSFYLVANFANNPLDYVASRCDFNPTDKGQLSKFYAFLENERQRGMLNISGDLAEVFS